MYLQNADEDQRGVPGGADAACACTASLIRAVLTVYEAAMRDISRLRGGASASTGRAMRCDAI